MSQVKIFWDPKGYKLDSLGTKKFIRITDGDTAYTSVPIRMLNIDTPEVHYPGNAKPSKQNHNLAQLAAWIDEGKAPINDALAAVLKPKLVTGQAGTLQEEQGIEATKVFKDLLTQKLTRESGSIRRLFIWAADEHFDGYGRLLAYISPSYNAKELSTMTLKQKATFNLLMVESGWAASFPIYPSLPRYINLVLFQQVAKEAYESKRGAWVDDLTLTGYEFRMCVKLFKVTEKLVNGKKVSTKEKYGWISRYCLDMCTREIFHPQDYYKVLPYNRIFVWPEDVVEAVGRINLLPA